MSNETPAWSSHAERMYLAWLARDARHALVALKLARNVANVRPPHQDLWLLMETFLIFVAKVSRTLFPVKTKGASAKWRQIRGEKLQEILDVNGNSPLANRDVRNAAEHFDEHIDDWIKKQQWPTADEVESGDWKNLHSFPFPTIYADSEVIEVAGRRLELAAIEHELLRVYERIRAMETLATPDQPELGYFIAGMTAGFPEELRISAPSRRPDESVLTGVDLDDARRQEQQFRAALEQLREEYRMLEKDNPNRDT